MLSFRRSMSAKQGDGASQNGGASFDNSLSPHKLAHSRTYLVLGRFMNKLAGSFDFLVVLESIRALQRYSLPVERSKTKGLHLKRIFLHFCVCFMLGIFISFTPLVSLDVNKNLASELRAFSIEEDVEGLNAKQETGVVKKEIMLLDKISLIHNRSLETVARWEVKKKVADSSDNVLGKVEKEVAGVSDNLPASYAMPPFQDELVLRKLLIIVTPTYERPFQAYYLNRLANTLRLVPPPLLWIVVEMSAQSTETAKVLRETGVMYRHLVCELNATTMKNREVHQRNIALAHIEKHQLDGIVHFADDDRIYSAELFDQMQKIRRLGTWPVAVLAESKNKVFLVGPVCNGSQVIGWHTNQRSKLSRRFHVDMSGFAFNSTILWDPKRWRRPTLEPVRQHGTIKEGFQESVFVEQLVEDESQVEGFPNDCSRIMVWHLHLEAPELSYPKGWLMQKNLEVVAPLT